MSPEGSKARKDRIRHHMRGYLATVDSPCCDIYQDLMTLYPKAKVVLSVRDSDDAWWQSFSRTLGVGSTKRYEWLVYPIFFLRANHILYQAITKRWMQLAGTKTLEPGIHRAHNMDVQSNVPPEKLLVFNVKMGWKPLCEFLEVPIPQEPFPNLSVIPNLAQTSLTINNRNDAAMISRTLTGAQLMGACVWLLYLGLAIFPIFGLAWLLHF